MLKRPEPHESFHGEDFKDKVGGGAGRLVHGVSDQLVDILLIGWWWGNQESTSTWFQPVWGLCACGQHTCFHLAGVSISPKMLKGYGSEYYLKSLRRNLMAKLLLFCCLTVFLSFCNFSLLPLFFYCKEFFFEVDHFKSLYWICYSVASVLCLVFWKWGLCDSSFPTINQSSTPCTGRWGPNHGACREVPKFTLKVSLQTQAAGGCVEAGMRVAGDPQGPAGLQWECKLVRPLWKTAWRFLKNQN